MSELLRPPTASHLRDYIRIARPDHWVKNIFMIPGAALAFVLVHRIADVSVLRLVTAVVSCCLMASANYTINEYLDAPFDRHHPLKRNRPGAEGRLDGGLVVAQYVVLATVGGLLAWTINNAFLITSLWLLVMGVNTAKWRGQST